MSCPPVSMIGRELLLRRCGEQLGVEEVIAKVPLNDSEKALGNPNSGSMCSIW